MLNQVTKWLQNSFNTDTLAGAFLLGTTILALLMANSRFYPLYTHIQALSFNLHQFIWFGSIHFNLLHLVNDGLMVIFFLLVGLEIKREFTSGELYSAANAILPFITAMAGMIVPALIFFFINIFHPHHWYGIGIPMATDIAFSLGILSLFGNKIPISIRIFLTTVAVIDDLGAILIIALFYGTGIKIFYLLSAIAIISMLFLFQVIFSYRFSLFIIIGFILWYFILKSGIHATIAGVILAFLLPNYDYQKNISPLKNWEHGLSPIVAFFIMPLFAFLNAGVNFSQLTLSELYNTLTIGIFLGLCLGKPFAIYGTISYSNKLNLQTSLKNAQKTQILGMSCLCGIGFTMSLFIGTLAFSGNIELMNEVKLGILSASLMSALLGAFFCRLNNH